MDAVKNVGKKEDCCHDCQKIMEIDGEEIKNGALLAFEVNGEKLMVFKCQECFDKSQELKNYQSCEVYSRIVGYLRPVQQWNVGKREEFVDRKEYKFSDGC